MRKLILVSATRFEIEPTLHFLSDFESAADVYVLGQLHIQICITGVGMVNTAFTLGTKVGEQFDFALNAGLAGSFKEHQNGTVVNVTEDCFSELGAEDAEQFITIDALGFGEQKVKPLKSLHSKILASLPQVQGITVNTVHGQEQSIATIRTRLSPQTESMEGAAFFMAANALGWSCAQVRAISNTVERRNRAAWEIPLAVKNLNDTLIHLLQTELNEVL